MNDGHNYTDLLQCLTHFAPFRDQDDAERALVTTLEVLGYVLPARLLDQLSTQLPALCAYPLQLGNQVSQSGRHPSTPGPLPPEVLERVQEVGAVLATMLSADLLAELRRALPAQLVDLFEREPAVRGGSQRKHAALVPAHVNSVANPNPHGDTKLSSASGLTQEREHRTLAEARPQH